MFENQNINDIDVHIIRRIYDQYLQQWSTDIRASPKADVYCMTKSDKNLEIENLKYITVVKNNCHRIALTRIRCSAHKLMIEEGRYRNIDRNQRFFPKCNMNVIENEFHFVLVCPFYKQLRNECLPRYYCHWLSLLKFKRYMKSTNKKLISKVAKFVYLATRLRG